MNIQLRDGLPFVTVSVTYQGQTALLANGLLDTGSAGTVLSTDRLLEIGLTMEPQDPLYRIHGVGGSEFVFGKAVDRIELDELHVENFKIEVGALAYGIELNGILGLDFLLAVGANIDLARLQISPAAPSL